VVLEQIHEAVLTLQAGQNSISEPAAASERDFLIISDQIFLIMSKNSLRPLPAAS
jgi:hypothetical protein